MIAHASLTRKRIFVCTEKKRLRFFNADRSLHFHENEILQKYRCEETILLVAQRRKKRDFIIREEEQQVVQRCR